MNPSNHEPDAWLAVLAGQQLATDRATRQAAGLREYVTRQIEVEREHQPDPVQEARLLARLRSRGAFAPPPAHSPRELIKPRTPRKSRLGWLANWLMNWLRPSRGHAANRASGQTRHPRHPTTHVQVGSGRYGVLKDWRTLALVGLIAVLAALLLLKHAGFWPGEGTEPALPNGIERGEQPQNLAQVIISANPAQSAAELKKRLAQAGVAATVTPEGSEIGASLLLQASLTPAQRQTVNAQIKTMNLTVPASGELVVRFKKIN